MAATAFRSRSDARSWPGVPTRSRKVSSPRAVTSKGLMTARAPSRRVVAYRWSAAPGGSDTRQRVRPTRSSACDASASDPERRRRAGGGGRRGGRRAK
eukprot:6954829-Prymnesium_polylepis.1